jgi:hypothetical protein
VSCSSTLTVMRSFAVSRGPAAARVLRSPCKTHRQRLEVVVVDASGDQPGSRSGEICARVACRGRRRLLARPTQASALMTDRIARPHSRRGTTRQPRKTR